MTLKIGRCALCRECDKVDGSGWCIACGDRWGTMRDRYEGGGGLGVLIWIMMLAIVVAIVVAVWLMAGGAP